MLYTTNHGCGIPQQRRGSANSGVTKKQKCPFGPPLSRAQLRILHSNRARAALGLPPIYDGGCTSPSTGDDGDEQALTFEPSSEQLQELGVPWSLIGLLFEMMDAIFRMAKRCPSVDNTEGIRFLLRKSEEAISMDENMPAIFTLMIVQLWLLMMHRTVHGCDEDVGDVDFWACEREDGWDRVEPIKGHLTPVELALAKKWCPDALSPPPCGDDGLRSEMRMFPSVVSALHYTSEAPRAPLEPMQVDPPEI